MTDPLPRRFGAALPGWTPPPRPARAPLEGRLVRLEPLTVEHADDLFAAHDRDANWDYLPYGPFADLAAMRDWVARAARGDDPLFFAIVDRASTRALGVASYLRIAPESGSIEIGHINLSPALQGTPGATEALALMMGWAFEAGYRRLEWKCDALNLASRRAARRLGFSFEGVFRQATVVKGRNRDTAWYSIIDGEWPARAEALATWLAPSNFDEAGRQRRSLSAMTRSLLASADPAEIPDAETDKETG